MALENSLVAIVRGKVGVGTGVVVGPRKVLTCAHVVNAALDRPMEEPSQPQNGRNTVNLMFHAAPGQKPTPATVDFWKGPTSGFERGVDLCVLALGADLPAKVEPALLKGYWYPVRKGYRAAGYPADWNTRETVQVDFSDGVIIGLDARGRWMLRHDPAAHATYTAGSSGGVFSDPQRPAGVIHRGFSGGPIEVDGRIAGIAAAARGKISDDTAYMISVMDFPEGLLKEIEAEMESTPVDEQAPHFDALYEYLVSSPRFASDDPPIDLRVRLCGSFNEALNIYKAAETQGSSGSETKRPEGYGEQDWDPVQFAKRLAVGTAGGKSLSRVWLLAPGGSGKSSFLRQLMLCAPFSKLVPFFLDFGVRSKPDESIPSSSSNGRATLASWFSDHETFGEVDDLFELAKNRTDAIKPLLVIDGINQSGRTREQDIRTISTLARGSLLKCVIIVADRLGPVFS